MNEKEKKERELKKELESQQKEAEMKDALLKERLDNQTGEEEMKAIITSITQQNKK